MNADRANRVAEEIAAISGAATAVHCDLGQEADVRELIGLATQTYGAVNIMLDNAGVAFMRELEEIAADQFRRLIEVNVVGVFLGCKRSRHSAASL